MFSIVFAHMLDVFYLVDQKKLYDDALFMMGMFFLIAGVAGVCNFIQPYLFGRAGERLTKALRTETFQSILRQDMLFFDCPVRFDDVLCSLNGNDNR
jgi:ATP-binding cassette, subfamily B (MDR/TAP), member 1